MSTIPLTLIEGSMAMPRARPLAQLPPPFGLDWKLLPPGYCIRVEIKALYAAVLRTFCLNDAAIRSMCKWLPLRQRGVDPVRNVEGVDRVAASVQVTRALPDATSAGGVAQVAAGHVEPSGDSRLWMGLAGGACALSGVAVLAWIAAGHVAHRHAAPLQNARVEGALFAGNISADAAIASRSAGVSHEAKQNASARSSSVAEFSDPRAATFPGSAVAASSVSAQRAPLKTSPASRDKYARQVRASRLNSLQRQEAKHDEIRHAPRRLSPRPEAAAMPRIVPLPGAVAHATPRPSAAGTYSPLAPSRLGTDEYANVSMFAGTHLHDIAPQVTNALRQASAASSANSTGKTSGTDWSNHMSQRRVTEMPDQFVK
jgi:hypothetical protein